MLCFDDILLLVMVRAVLVVVAIGGGSDKEILSYYVPAARYTFTSRGLADLHGQTISLSSSIMYFDLL